MVCGADEGWAGWGVCAMREVFLICTFVIYSRSNFVSVFYYT